MQAILQDESTICVRDMPSFFACATELTSHLKSVTQGYKFESQIDKIVDNDPKIAQMVGDLENDETQFIQMMENLQTMTNAAINDEAKEAAQDVLKCLVILDNLDTLEVIRALFVLPLETARCQGELSLKN